MSGTWDTGWSVGDVLTATEFKKAGGLIYDTTLGGDAASIDVTGIIATYGNLTVNVYARGVVAAGEDTLRLRFNNDSTNTYYVQEANQFAATTNAAESLATSSCRVGTCPANTGAANRFGVSRIWIPNYANTVNQKVALAFAFSPGNTGSGTLKLEEAGSVWVSTAAINRVTVYAIGGNLKAGTRLQIFCEGIS